MCNSRNGSVNVRYIKQVSVEATLEHCQCFWCVDMGRQVVPSSWTSNRRRMLSNLCLWNIEVPKTAERLDTRWPKVKQACQWGELLVCEVPYSLNVTRPTYNYHSMWQGRFTEHNMTTNKATVTTPWPEKNGPLKPVKITLWIENVSDYFSLYHEMPSICNVHVKFHDN